MEASKEVVMSDAPPVNTLEEENNKEKTEPLLTILDIQQQVNEIIKGVQEKEPRIVVRVVRKVFANTRRRLTHRANLFKKVITENLSSEDNEETNKWRDELLNYISKLPITMEVVENKEQQEQSSLLEKQKEEEKKNKNATTEKPVLPSSVPEVAVFLHLVTTVLLIDNKLNEEAITCSTSLVQRLTILNRRTLNPLAAKAFFYFSYSYELCNRLAEIRTPLLAAYRTSSLRHDDETHATILNLLLRNYLHYNLVDQADKLQAKSIVKEDSTSSAQLARFKYYQGKIKGIQLDYTGAYTDLQEALRKAPQRGARGFKQTVQKVTCIVQLLMGEIPERSIFRQKGYKIALKPYLQLTQAVRVGDLDAFHAVVKEHDETFKRDKTLTLIHRLRHNVIKTGLRKINISYSRIHFKDICNKLRLDNLEDVEFIVAKAIRDGVIDAAIDHEGGFISSKENMNAYSTQEPLEVYNARVQFCLKMHNEAVKSMRYPDAPTKKSIFDADKKDGEDEDEAKQREREKNELVKKVEEDLDEEEEDDEL